MRETESDETSTPPPTKVLRDRASRERPERHAAFGAHWIDDQGATWCARCDVLDIRPLTFDEWLEGGGGEDARDLFESDYDALTAGIATPEQVERMRYAFAKDDD